jgi:nucleotide-binding universal stress UspA family protein
MMDTTHAHGRAYRRILLPLDGSPLAEQALAYGAELAAAGAELLLLRVIPEPKAIRDRFGEVSATADEVLRRSRQNAIEELIEAVERVRALTLEPSVCVVVAVGDPAEQIMRVAETRRIDLILMTSHGRGAIGRLAFGSVADRVARSSPVPVLVTRPRDADTASVGIRRLVVPLDGSELSRQALPAAVALAQQFGLPLRLVSVLDLWSASSPALAYGAAFGQELYDDLMHDAEALQSRMLEDAAAPLRASGLSVEATLLHGPVAQAIMVATAPGDVIVMTSHGTSGVTRWLLGSVAEKLVREGPVPVMLLRAEQETATLAPAPVGLVQPIAAGA